MLEQRDFTGLQPAWPPPGSLLLQRRTGYDHYAILCEDGLAIEYSVRAGGRVIVRIIDDFLAMGLVEVIAMPQSRHEQEQILARAWSRAGESHYNLLFNNCEHFATWCFYGVSTSSQVTSWTYAALFISGVSLICYGLSEDAA